MNSDLMTQCCHCDEPICSDAEQCPHCRVWFADQLIARTTHSDADVRESAVSNLVFVARTEKTVAALADALDDPVANVRRAAGVMLFISGAASKYVVPALTPALDHRDSVVRRSVASALTNVGSHGRTAIPKLTELRDTDDDQLRLWVAEALKRIGEGVPATTA